MQTLIPIVVMSDGETHDTLDGCTIAFVTPQQLGDLTDGASLSDISPSITICPSITTNS